MTMRQARNYSLFLLLASSPTFLLGHGVHTGEESAHHGVDTAVAVRAALPFAGISGQGDLKFRVLYAEDHLPAKAVEVLRKAHGGFAVDRREGRGETYFALPGAGIVRLSADLRTASPIETDASMKDVNLHNTTIWYSAGEAYLTFPANGAGKVFTTKLDGTLVHTLEISGGRNNFGDTGVNEYFKNQGKFAPTDVEHLGNLLYVTTGYSKLDYVLTAKISNTHPFKAAWNNLTFGGKGKGPGKFGTGHGITVPPGEERLDISDRPNSQVDRFTRYGNFLDSVVLPNGSFPCDIDYVNQYAIVGCLHGPDRSKGAPIYILKKDRVVSTIMPKEELGLERFQHIHNAVLRMLDGKLYILAQAWNPGDFAILEQVD